MNWHKVKDSHDRPDSVGGDGGPGEAAAFISEAITDLALLARRHGHQTLGFLLDMAQMEADEIARLRHKPGGF
jgi:hypothetical protein